MLALRVQDGFQIYEVDATGRQAESTICPCIRYEDLHPAATPTEVYEAPDGRWTMRHAPAVLDPEPVPMYESFEYYVHTLPPWWEADLLQHVELSLDPAYLCFNFQLYFYGGSDGSVKLGSNGSFGWMLANTEGDRVAWAMGPARCATMDSYRAECTGMLSFFLRFLLRISIYVNSDIFWRGLVVGTDSQSMLNRLFKKGTHPGIPKELAILDVLNAEWDLLVEIQHALRELPGVDLTYVLKGHQDDKKAYDRLPLMAGKYNQDHGARHPFSFLAPNTGAFLLTVDGP